VEVNSATVGILTRTYRDFFAPWVGDPRVRLVNDEGRHYLASHPGRYDVIQLSGVDSFAGTAAAAHVFTENYLRRGAAGREHRGHRSPRRELPRPFVPAEMRRLGAWASESRLFTLVAGRGFTRADRTPTTNSWAWAPPRPRARSSPGIRSTSAPFTDDSPFFFRHSYWRHLAEHEGVVGRSVPVLEYSLVILLGLTGLAAAVFIYLPLRFLAGRRPPVRTGLFFGPWCAATFGRRASSRTTPRRGCCRRSA
jgi:hypothetical protein